MTDVDITLEQGAFLVKDKSYEFSDGFINFLTKSNITYVDNIEEDENKIKMFLKDITYDVGKGDKKSARYGTINSTIIIHSTIIMTTFNVSNNPDKIRYIREPASQIISTSSKIEPKFKVSDYVRNADKRNIFSKGYTSNWNRELLKANEVLNTQPLTY